MNKHRPLTGRHLHLQRTSQVKIFTSGEKTLQSLTHTSSIIRSTQKSPHPTHPLIHNQNGSPNPNNEPPKGRQVRTAETTPRPTPLQGRRNHERRSPHQGARRSLGNDGP